MRFRRTNDSNETANSFQMQPSPRVRINSFALSRYRNLRYRYLMRFNSISFAFVSRKRFLDQGLRNGHHPHHRTITHVIQQRALLRKSLGNVPPLRR